MQTSEAEYIEITTEEFLNAATKVPLITILVQLRNTGNIKDQKLRKLCREAKLAIKNVEQYVQELFKERQA